MQKGSFNKNITNSGEILAKKDLYILYRRTTASNSNPWNLGMCPRHGTMSSTRKGRWRSGSIWFFIHCDSTARCQKPGKALLAFRT